MNGCSRRSAGQNAIVSGALSSSNSDLDGCMWHHSLCFSSETHASPTSVSPSLLYKSLKTLPFDRSLLSGDFEISVASVGGLSTRWGSLDQFVRADDLATTPFNCCTRPTFLHFTQMQVVGGPPFIVRVLGRDRLPELSGDAPNGYRGVGSAVSGIFCPLALYSASSA